MIFQGFVCYSHTRRGETVWATSEEMRQQLAGRNTGAELNILNEPATECYGGFKQKNIIQFPYLYSGHNSLYVPPLDCCSLVVMMGPCLRTFS